jgi:MFS transporter, FHS family, glucose/mannose:H+ symporter
MDVPLPRTSSMYKSPRVAGPPEAVPKRRLLALLHAGFVLTGLVCSMLGPLLPVLSARWGLNDTHAGYLFTAQFSGSMLGVLASSFLMSRGRHRTSLLLGLGLTALGAAALLAGSWMLALASTFCWGIGFGLLIPTTNLLVSELHPEKRAAALNLVNFSWGVGAATCPFFVAALLRMHRISLLLYGVAALLIVVAAGVVAAGVAAANVAAANVVRAPRPDHCPTPDEVLPVESVWRSRWVPILGAIFFLYVGCEAGLSGWSATYAQRMAESGTEWALIPSFFWFALLTGRASAPLFLKKVQEIRLAKFGLALSTLGIVALLAARNLSGIAIGVSLAGLGLSSVYPIAIATLSRKFGAMAPRIAGYMFALAAAGGATLPWLVGYISTRQGSLQYGLFVPLFASIVMLILNQLLSQTS